MTGSKRMALAALLLALSALPAAAQESVMGTWLSASGVAKVRLEPCLDPSRGPVCGFVVGLVDPKGPDGKVVPPDQAVDYRNPDPRLRGRKVVGMPLLWGFKKTSDPNSFEDGQIYNGENGKTYNANISLQPDGKLRLRGYVGTPMFGETQIWTRIN